MCCFSQLIQPVLHIFAQMRAWSTWWPRTWQMWPLILFQMQHNKNLLPQKLQSWPSILSSLGGTLAAGWEAFVGWSQHVLVAHVSNKTQMTEVTVDNVQPMLATTKAWIALKPRYMSASSSNTANWMGTWFDCTWREELFYTIERWENAACMVFLSEQSEQRIQNM